MNQTAKKLLQQAIALPESDRAEIASRLMDSLPGPLFASPEIAAAWDAEIQRRIESVERGEVELLPWDDVKKELWNKYGLNG